MATIKVAPASDNPDVSESISQNVGKKPRSRVMLEMWVAILIATSSTLIVMYFLSILQYYDLRLEVTG